MGGFGALHTGLMFNDTFSKIIALSSALIVKGLKHMSPEDKNPMANYAYYTQMFGDLAKAEETDHNPEVLVKKILADKSQMPDIYLACGTEDFLYGPNTAFKEFLDSMKVPVKFFAGPGIHDYNFWRAQLKAGLDWALADEE